MRGVSREELTDGRQLGFIDDKHTRLRAFRGVDWALHE
jgi:hypothetical protein